MHSGVDKFNYLVPFELEALHARLRYWAGDFVGYGVIKKCKLMVKTALEEGERRGSVGTGIGGGMEELLSPRCGGREGVGWR
jgi:hypothetical protein